MFCPVIWLDFRLMALHWCVLPKLFDKHHTGSVSCQLACDVVVGNVDKTGRRTQVEMLTSWLWWEYGLDRTTDTIDMLTSWPYRVPYVTVGGWEGGDVG